MGLLKEKYEQVKASIAKFFNREEEERKRVVEMPSEGSDEVSDYVQALWDEGLESEYEHFRQTVRTRPRFGLGKSSYTTDPRTWREHCERLLGGHDWEVTGRRNDSSENAWKQEVVTNMIANKMRVRRQYITSNYHDVTISPNLENIDAVFEQERKASGWGDWVDDYATDAMQYGSSISRVMLDLTENPQGHIRDVVCSQGSVVRTPNTASLAKRDGCWYAVHGTMVNHYYVEQNFPKADFGEMHEARFFDNRKLSGGWGVKADYAHTKMYAMYEVFVDSDELEAIPFNEEEQIALVAEIMMLQRGEEVVADPNQHHLKHIEAKQAALEAFSLRQELSEDNLSMLSDKDVVFANHVAVMFEQNIAEHKEAIEGDELQEKGLRYKYPAGRYIVRIGGVVAEDKPNPYCSYERNIVIDWRRLFRELKNEKVRGRNDGKGDPEILFEDNNRANTALSRFADTVLLAMPKVARHESDKGGGNNTVTNDPTEHIWFKQIPPTILHAPVSTESLKEYEIAIANSDRSSAVNDITIAGEPKGQSSGYQTALLQRQNAMIVTGELDRNLRGALEDIIETHIDLWRVFFTDDRPYFIGAEQVPINVAALLEPYRKFQIMVRPFSNHPFRWEQRLGVLTDIVKMTDPMGAPLYPDAALALRDHIAVEYPDFAENGKYGKMSQVIQLATQLLAQQQQQLQAQQQQQQQVGETIQGVRKKYQRKAIEQEMVGGNVLPMQ